MKKTLLATVVTAALTPAALAQSVDPVTLYGRIYVTVESVEAKGQLGAPVGGVCSPPACAVPVPSRTRVADQASYLGIPVQGPYKPDHYRY